MEPAWNTLLLGIEAADALHAAAVVVLLAILGAGLRAVIRAAEADRRRNRRLAKLAESMDCTFMGQVTPADAQTFKPFTWFIRSGEQYILNTFDCELATRHGRAAVRMGDYRTVTRLRSARGREVRQIAEFSYMLLDLPFDTEGRLLVRPHGHFDAIASRFGAEDLDFESAEFNRHFLVRASSRRFAYDVLHPGTMDLLMTTEPFPVLIDGRRCCVTDATSRWTAALFQSKLGWFREFLEAFPAHVAGRGG